MTRCSRPRLVASAVVLAAALTAGSAAAHPMRFGTLTVQETGDRAATARLRFSGSERHPDAAEIVLPDACVDATPAVARPIPYGVERERRAHCPAGAIAAGPIGVRGIGEDARGDSAQVALRLELGDGTRVETMLDASAPVWRAADDTVAAPGAGAVLARYGALGVEHILLGFDHLLFLAVLLLMVPERRALVVAITAFTAGHSLTLALAVLDVVRVPGPAVEAAIALSIAVVAAEVVRRRRVAVLVPAAFGRPPGVVEPTSLRTAALVPAAFGLVHGLGFAGALRELGLPEGQLAAALLSFNLGVELGQLLFVLVAVVLVATARRARSADRLARVAPQLTAYAAGTIAAWLTLERLLTLG